MKKESVEKLYAKKLDMKKATERYNNIMWDLCCEHLSIGTRLSENTDGWTLRDMVAEADYQLSCYYESGHCRCDDRFLSKEDYKIWLSETGKLKRFIKAYDPFIQGLECITKHCSKYDNRKEQ